VSSNTAVWVEGTLATSFSNQSVPCSMHMTEKQV